MNTKHSPAPWRLQILKSNGDQYVSRGKQGPVIAEITTNDQVPAFSKEEAEANAHLIAAAPELLKALEWITRCAHMTSPIGSKVYFISDKAMAEAIEAVKKATNNNQ